MQSNVSCPEPRLARGTRNEPERFQYANMPSMREFDSDELREAPEQTLILE